MRLRRAAPDPKGKNKKAAARRPKEAVIRPSTWYLLIGIVGVLVVIGLVMVLSASSVQSQREFGSTWSYFLRQVIWTFLSVGACVVMSRIDYRRWRPLVPVLLVGSFALLLIVLVPGVGLQVNGARSWLGRGMFRMQPSELVKLALLLFSADLLARRHNRMDDARLTLVPVLVVVGATAFLMMLQPDLGSTMVMGAIVLSVLFVSGVPLGRLGAVSSIGSAGALALALSKPYRRNRLLAFLDPSKDPGNTGYQINQSLMGVASGGLFGVGLGQSRAKWGFLPNAHTDFIFAIIGEELGLFGGIGVIALFIALAVFGIRSASRAPDPFGALVAGGITAWLVGQAALNMATVVGVLPVTGVPLPFVSLGGTSTMFGMAAAGIVINIARQGRRGAPAR